MSQGEPKPGGIPAALEDHRWADAQRIESWAGEVRVNLIRMAALVVFYGYHLVEVYHFRNGPVLTGAYHVGTTAVVLGWGGTVVVLHWCLSRRLMSPAVKYVATLWDIVLITALLMLGDGAKSPLVILYFLAIAAAPLRLSLRLVYVATLGSMAAYLFLLGWYAWYLVGFRRYYESPQLRIPRTQEIAFLLGLGAAGILAGQVVRQVRRLMQGYPVAVQEPREN